MLFVFHVFLKFRPLPYPEQLVRAGEMHVKSCLTTRIFLHRLEGSKVKRCQSSENQTQISPLLLILFALLAAALAFFAAAFFALLSVAALGFATTAVVERGLSFP